MLGCGVVSQQPPPGCCRVRVCVQECGGPTSPGWVQRESGGNGWGRGSSQVEKVLPGLSVVTLTHMALWQMLTSNCLQKLSHCVLVGKRACVHVCCTAWDLDAVNLNKRHCKNHDRRALKSAHIAYRMALPLPLLWRKICTGFKRGEQEQTYASISGIKQRDAQTSADCWESPPHLT